MALNSDGSYDPESFNPTAYQAAQNPDGTWGISPTAGGAVQNMSAFPYLNQLLPGTNNMSDAAYQKMVEELSRANAAKSDPFSYAPYALMALTGAGLASGALSGAGAAGEAGAAGSAAGALPDSYWNMIAQGGGAASDAAPAAAGSIGGTGGGMDLADWLSSMGYDTGGMTFPSSGALEAPYGNYGVELTNGLGDLSGTGAYSSTPTGLSLSDIAKALGKNGLSSVAGSLVQGLGSLLASKTQANAGANANNTLWSMFQQNRADQAPYMAAGYGALGRLTDLTTPGNQFTAMQADPGYQWRLDQGQNALDNKMRAAGKFYSGANIKAGQDYAQNFASNEFGNVFNRNAALAGIGQTATNNVGAQGTSTANNVANNQTGIGNVRASGYTGIGNAVQSGLNTYNAMNQQDALMALLPQLLGKG